MKINVGDVIYVLDNKTHTIIPCKIVEKVSSVREDGEKIYHIVNAPSGKSFKIEDVKTPWFITIDEAKNHLTDAAKKLINATAEKALSVAKKTFGHEVDNSIDDISSFNTSTEDLNSFDKETVMVEFSDGQKANIILPEELMHENNTSS